MKNFLLWIVILALVVLDTRSSKAQWIKTNSPYGAQHFVSLDGYIFAGGCGNWLNGDGWGVLRSADSGKTWSRVINGLPGAPQWDGGTSVMYARPLITLGHTIYTGYSAQYNGVYRSTDYGASWTRSSDGLAEGDVNALFEKDGILFAGIWWDGDSNGVYASTNGGDNWFSCSNGLTIDSKIFCFASNGDKLIAGSWGGSIYMTSDDGHSWQLIDTALLNNGVSYVYGLSLVGDTLVATARYAGAFRTTDFGKSWAAASDGLQCNGVFSVATSGKRIFAGALCGNNGDPSGTDGVFTTTDFGNQWTRLNDGLESTYIDGVAVIGGYVFASSDGRANNGNGNIYRMPLSALTAVNQASIEPPLSCLIENNYPNPFSVLTDVEFTLPQSEHATLKVFNALGQEIETLVDGEQSSGNHSAIFNAGHLQNGVYWCRLTAGRSVTTQKMVVVR